MILVDTAEADTIDVMDRGLQYGDGLFETVAIVGGRPRFWNRHVARLTSGCDRLGIPLPDVSELTKKVHELGAGEHHAVLKVMVTRGTGGRGYRAPICPTPRTIISKFPRPEYPGDWASTGVDVRLCDTPLGHSPALAGIKHLNRLEQVLARSEWEDPSVAEGLMCDPEGNVVEGTMSNLFMRRENELLTPSLDRCGVSGIMREWVLEVAPRLGLKVRTGKFALAALWQADELFLTNAIIGIWPVSRLESHRYKEKRVAITLSRLLQEESDGQADI